MGANTIIASLPPVVLVYLYRFPPRGAAAQGPCHKASCRYDSISSRTSAANVVLIRLFEVIECGLKVGCAVGEPAELAPCAGNKLGYDRLRQTAGVTDFFDREQAGSREAADATPVAPRIDGNRRVGLLAGHSNNRKRGRGRLELQSGIVAFHGAGLAPFGCAALLFLLPFGVALAPHGDLLGVFEKK